MLEEDARALVGIIQAYYPNWISGLSEEEREMTVTLWERAFNKFDENYDTMLALVEVCLEIEGSNFVPNVNYICAFIRRRLADVARSKRQNEQGRKFIEDRRKHRDSTASPAAKECFAAVKKLTDGMEKYKEDKPEPPDTSDKQNWTGVNRSIQDTKNQPKVDTTPLKAEDFPKRN